MTTADVEGPAGPPRPEAAHRRSRVTRVVGVVGLVGMVVFNTYVSLSAHVATWWEKESESNASTLPRSVRGVLAARPSTSQADVHLTLWCITGLFAVLAARTWRVRWILLGCLVAYGGLIEIAQHWTKTRSPQWGDFAGDSIGVGLAAVVAAVVGWVVSQRSTALEQSSGVV